MLHGYYLQKTQSLVAVSRFHDFVICMSKFSMFVVVRSWQLENAGYEDNKVSHFLMQSLLFAFYFFFIFFSVFVTWVI